ncbi:MAG: mannose-1-phosphate guanylyltransferase [Aggregatilineales bacterium]
MDNYYVLILAGGGGTRLWPKSRKDTPKQLLPLIDERSMFQMTVERVSSLFPPEHIYISTGRSYVDGMQADVPAIPQENFIVEPSGRDSAAAAGLSLAVIQQRDPKATIAMLSVDHYIEKEDVFLDVLKAAYEVAQKQYIVTLGITPTFPSTAFGYIQRGTIPADAGGFQYYDAIRFAEKPDQVKATRFVNSGNYSWNAGMFIWRAEDAMNEFERQQPEMYALFNRLQKTVDTDKYESTLDEIWADIPKKSLDYAIMENAEKMAIIPTELGWSDVGTWKSLYEVLPQDKLGNAFKGHEEDNHLMLDTQNTFVFSPRMTVLIGVEDLIVVESDDVLLICHQDRSQDVKKIVNYLKENDKTDYL